MKVGILTFHFAHNYGAMLQAYGLSKYISSLGYECNIVDYRLRYINQWVEKYDLKSYYKAQREDGFGFIRSLLRTIRYYPRLNQQKDERWTLFSEFMNSKLPLSRRIYDRQSIGKGYDALIVGSDQIWNGELTDGLQDVYFLNIPFDGKKIAYAASSGNDFIEGDQEYIFHALSGFDYLSCRESGLTSFCSKVIERDVITVCDPIFLLDKSEWEDICVEPVIMDEYILVYGFDENKLFLDVIQSVSKKLNLPVVRIGKKELPSVTTKTYNTEAGPTEFLTLFKNASFVITNTFHGVSTSLVFNRPFITVLPPKRINRILNILSVAGINDRIVKKIDEVFQVLESSIDYNEIEYKLEPLRQSSREFIHKSLAIKNG